MKKVLLYGNCQLGLLSRLIDKHIKNIEIIRPQKFGIPIENRWQKEVFYPKTVLKNNSLLKALEICDIFIFQNIKNEDFWKTEELIKNPGKRDDVVVTTFYFDYDNSSESIIKLENRSEYINKTYKCHHIDMVPWIKQNYNKTNLLKNRFMHPIDKFYEDTLIEICKTKIFDK
jgi:hypothetical protein